MNILKEKQSFIQLIRFGMVGVFNTAVDYGVFYMLIAFVHLHKGFAQVIATGIAMCGSFLINRYWTFRKTGRSTAGEVVRFVLTNAVSMLTAIAFTYLFYDILHAERVANGVLTVAGISYMLEGNMAVMFCKMLSTVFSLAVNFIGNKFWVFRAGEEETK